MSRIPSLSSPFLLGFEEIERALDRVAKAADGYPPYNIERLAKTDEAPERLRITLAVAGFSRAEIEITVEENELVIRGRQKEPEQNRVFLHRGIAARQFQRTLLLADGMRVANAELSDGLLAIDVERLEEKRSVRRIEISAAATK
jgi:HSP20 family molecular chaperone IbpA